MKSKMPTNSLNLKLPPNESGKRPPMKFVENLMTAGKGLLSDLQLPNTSAKSTVDPLAPDATETDRVNQTQTKKGTRWTWLPSVLPISKAKLTLENGFYYKIAMILLIAALVLRSR